MCQGLRRAAATGAVFLAFSTVAVAAERVPNNEQLRRMAHDLYPGLMAGERPDIPLIVGMVLNASLEVEQHSATIPRPRENRMAGDLLTEVFPRLPLSECGDIGSAIVQPQGKEVARRVLVVWCRKR
jgi:hypothetical protein